MPEVEREIDNKLREKQRQAMKMPTSLLLDFSRVRWAWLRPAPSGSLPHLGEKLACHTGTTATSSANRSRAETGHP
jgi:hypothetical protein